MVLELLLELKDEQEDEMMMMMKEVFEREHEAEREKGCGLVERMEEDAMG